MEPTTTTTAAAVAVEDVKTKFIYECPDDYEGINLPSVFLAGGITGCPDWQSEMKTKLREGCPELLIFNPRRATFDVTDESAFDTQVRWEERHLYRAHVILFWFPKETVCPITLFELGKWMALAPLEGKEIIVGCHPEYTRRRDVKLQLDLYYEYNVPVYSSIEEVFAETKKCCDRYLDGDDYRVKEEKYESEGCYSDDYGQE